MKKLTEITQITLLAFTLIFFAWDLTTQAYTSFTASPPNYADKTWYLGEAVLFLIFSFCLYLLNKELKQWNYADSWGFLALFFTFRTLWTIIWITLGLSANLNIAQAILFSIIFASIFCITFLPYIKKILKNSK